MKSFCPIRRRIKMSSTSCACKRCPMIETRAIGEGRSNSPYKMKNLETFPAQQSTEAVADTQVRQNVPFPLPYILHS